MIKVAPVNIRTNEGAAAVKEAIVVVGKMAARHPLQWSSSVAKASLDHAKDTVNKGFIGHTGSDKSTPSVRIARYGKMLYGSCSENITYG